MRAARLHAYGKPFRIEDVPIPKPGYGEVLLRVSGAGFCHSDVHIATGELPLLPRMPITLGHENAGVVTACGPGVTSVREGDPVLVFGGWGDGTCAHCLSGNEQLCEQPAWSGVSGPDGGYAEFMLVPRPQYLVPLHSLSPREAAPLADAALTPYRAVRLALPFLEPDFYALVIGIGGLGEYGLKLIRTLSGCRVIAVDVAERKLRIAKELGASEALNGGAKDLAKQVLDITGGHGVCAAFDFVGSNETLSLAISTTRSRGKVSQIGLAGGTASLEVLKNSRFEVTFEATLWGTVKELHEVVALAESGRLGKMPLEYAPLEAINDVLGRVKRGEVDGRIVITPNA